MRPLTFALPLAAALVLVVPATAARKPPGPTPTKFTGTPVFVSTPFAADTRFRDVTVSVPFTHRGTVVVRGTFTFSGVTYEPDWGFTFHGSGSDTFTRTLSGGDCLEPGPGDTLSWHLQLISPKGAVLDEITTQTYVIT